LATNQPVRSPTRLLRAPSAHELCGTAYTGQSQSTTALAGTGGRSQVRRAVLRRAGRLLTVRPMVTAERLIGPRLAGNELLLVLLLLPQFGSERGGTARGV
jgi:hypothetical protein